MVSPLLTGLLNGYAAKCRYPCTVAAYEASSHYAIHVVLTGWRPMDQAYQNVQVASMIGIHDLHSYGPAHVVRAILGTALTRLEHELDALPFRIALRDQTELLRQLA